MTKKDYREKPINISVLGSTGSIGTQTLQVVDQFKGVIKVVGLAAGGNLDLLKSQVKKYKPRAVSVKSEQDAKKIGAFWGDEGNCKVATLSDVDRVVVATPGLAGIKPTLKAIGAKKKIALATKEVLVSAGELVTFQAQKNKVEILPIDSEHSAIFQCLEGKSSDEVKRIILTASGGPFRGKKLSDLKNITPEQALAHPTWKMGQKISIDSATLMNKGFEVIEAMWLFGVDVSKIDVIVHPQSVIHSAVEFVDGSIIAQVGPSDMRLPIQHALLFPRKRQANNFKKFSFNDYSSITFEEPDLKTFRCLALAFEAVKIGRGATAVLTAANDVAVDAFLGSKLPFLAIAKVNEATLGAYKPKKYSSLEQILEIDTWARVTAGKFVSKYKK